MRDRGKRYGVSLSSRTVLKIGAWSVPVIATAVAVPSAVASGECVDGPVDLTAMGWSAVGDLQSNWGNETTTGWIGSFQGAAGGNATQNVTGLTNGFLSQDDNDSATEIATVTMTISLPVVNGASYAFDLESSVGYGNPGGQQASALTATPVSGHRTVGRRSQAWEEPRPRNLRPTLRSPPNTAAACGIRPIRCEALGTVRTAPACQG